MVQRGATDFAVAEAFAGGALSVDTVIDKSTRFKGDGAQ
jgi:hypothetical protein